MKKIIAFLMCAIIIALVIFVNWYSENQKSLSEIQAYNNEYKMYFTDEKGNLRNISGVDLTTLINKAIDNNEKCELGKDEKGAYILNEENSIEILVRVEPKGSYFLMEAFALSGMTDFTILYGQFEFECEEIEYHKNGKISKIVFGIIK